MYLRCLPRRVDNCIHFVTPECLILVGIYDEFSWIRCEGKGSFQNSALMKAFGDERINDGEICLVVDLEACTGMDSTFMGTLGGMATRISSRLGGLLQITAASERNRRSLEDLGLDFFMEIDPAEALWRGQLTTIRSDLKLAKVKQTLPGGRIQRTEHILQAHQTLAAANEKNAQEFSAVVKLLGAELQQKLKRKDS